MFTFFHHSEVTRNTSHNFPTLSYGPVVIKNPCRHHISSRLLKSNKETFHRKILRNFFILLNKHRLNPDVSTKYRLIEQNVNLGYFGTEYYNSDTVETFIFINFHK